MIDKIETLMHSLIQHGKLNDRIYLLKLAHKDCPEIIFQIDNLAKKKGYSKLIAKVPSEFRQCFIDEGFLEEAHIPGFFNGKVNKKENSGKDAFLMARFRDAKRSNNLKEKFIDDVLEFSRKKGRLKKIPHLNPCYAFRIADKGDSESMANLYKEVFPTYPFPVDNPDYLAQTMNENSLYFSIWKGNQLVCLSSVEMDKKEKNAEMTDFATLPDHRGQGFALFLLEKMEKEIRKRGIKTAYTIARALSFGMNITFAQAGYTYSGTLINNTNISGQIESMNIWYKILT